MDDSYRNWHWFFVLGIITIGLGVLAAIAPLNSSLTFEIWIGVIFIIAGLAQALHAFWSRRWGGFFFELFGAVHYLLVGLMLLANPGTGVIMLTLLLAMLFIMQGMVQFAMSAQLQPKPSRDWMFISGFVAVLLGVLTWTHWPGSTLWLIGLFVGIHLLFRGWSVIHLAILTRQLANTDLARLQHGSRENSRVAARLAAER